MVEAARGCNGASQGVGKVQLKSVCVCVGGWFQYSLGIEHRSGIGGTEVAPDMKRSVDMEVIDGAGSRISG